MKLLNKETGKAVILQNRDDLRVLEDYHIYINIYDGSVDLLYKEDDEHQKHYHYSTFEMFRLKWKEYEEPKGYFYIRDGGNIDYYRKEGSITERHKSIGNYFATKEEAEKAVEKLKAWKRLKGNGFKFQGWFDGNISVMIDTNIKFSQVSDEIIKDFNFLFRD